MRMIVVGGEALIDLVPEPSTMDNSLAPLRPFPGGGPYNVAISVGRLGIPVRFLSRLSTDIFGDALLRRLHESGVDSSMVQRGDEVTTLSLGTLSLLLEPGASTYETLLRRHARRGGLTVLDPNIRPVLVRDPAAHRARFASWLPDIG